MDQTWKNWPKITHDGIIFILTLAMAGIPVLGSFNVNLKLQNAGDPNHSDVLTPETTVTINCTFDLALADAMLVTLGNSSGSSIYDYTYASGTGVKGPGFNNLISLPQGSNEGWFSVDLTLPSCYRDNMIKCTVYNNDPASSSDSKHFTIASVTKPFITSDSESVTEIQVKERVTLICSVYMVTPQVSLVWEPSHCVQIISASNVTEDTSRCFFNQTTTARITWPLRPGCQTLKCIAQSSSGLPSQTTEVKLNSGPETGGALSPWLFMYALFVALMGRQT